MKENSCPRKVNRLVTEWISSRFHLIFHSSSHSPSPRNIFSIHKRLQESKKEKDEREPEFMIQKIKDPRLHSESPMFGSEFLIYNLWRQHVIQKVVFSANGFIFYSIKVQPSRHHRREGIINPERRWRKIRSKFYEK